MAKKFIKAAIEHPGAFREEAHKAGKTTREYAVEKEHAKGTLGRRARLALTLMGMSHHHDSEEKKSEEPKADRIKRRYPTHSKE